MLCDFSIMRMSLRFERERVKLRAKIDLRIAPEIVQRQLSVYELVKVKKSSVLRHQAE